MGEHYFRSSIYVMSPGVSPLSQACFTPWKNGQKWNYHLRGFISFLLRLCVLCSALLYWWIESINSNLALVNLNSLSALGMSYTVRAITSVNNKSAGTTVLVGKSNATLYLFVYGEPCIWKYTEMTLA